MNNLYEIATEYEKALSEIYDPESGELIEGSLIALDEIKAPLEKKLTSIAAFMQNMNAEREAIEKARLSMQEREKRIKRKYEALNDYLHTNMARCGINEVKCPYFTLKIKKNPLSVEIYDESCIQDEYKKTVTEIKIDKIKVKNEIQQGVIIEGARLVQNTRLEIK